MRIYKPSERHEFDPGPCPKCGGTYYRVNWVDISNGPWEGEDAVPGTVECLNPNCEWGPGPNRVDDYTPGDVWVPKLPTD